MSRKVYGAVMVREPVVPVSVTEDIVKEIDATFGEGLQALGWPFGTFVRA
jgi:hypothetical protein